jgi:hypothetical protein
MSKVESSCGREDDTRFGDFPSENHVTAPLADENETGSLQGFA